MLDSLPAESRPVQGNGQDLPATRLSPHFQEKFSPAVRLLLFAGGAVVSWALVAGVVWLLHRAL
jgi:hypothetical protein